MNSLLALGTPWKIFKPERMGEPGCLTLRMVTQAIVMIPYDTKRDSESIRPRLERIIPTTGNMVNPRAN